MNWIVFTAGLATCFFASLGCTPTSDEAPRASDRIAARQNPVFDANGIYHRKNTQFPFAHLVKPTRTRDETLEFKLAPFVLQQVSGTSPESMQPHRFGRVARSEDSVRIDASQPTIYFGSSTAILSGREHPQITFRWWYPGENGAPPIAQGLRLTLDADGFPAITELLEDGSGALIIVVNETLEAAARMEHGDPAAQRTFSVERTKDAAPRVVVARAIAPGPIPMGPFVYASATQHSIETLICRCMPTQFDDLAGESFYELRPESELVAEGERVPAWTAPLTHDEDTPDDPRSDPSWLEQVLRLPTTF